jgi:hypothetical protein
LKSMGWNSAKLPPMSRPPPDRTEGGQEPAAAGLAWPRRKTRITHGLRLLAHNVQTVDARYLNSAPCEPQPGAAASRPRLLLVRSAAGKLVGMRIRSRREP